MFSFVAVLVAASVSLASVCANFCLPSESLLGDSSVSHEHGSSMNADASDSTPSDAGTAGCRKDKSADDGTSSDDTGESSSAAQCDGEYILSSSIIKVEPVKTNLIMLHSSLGDISREPALLGLLSVSVNDSAETYYSEPLYIRHSVFLI